MKRLVLIAIVFFPYLMSAFSYSDLTHNPQSIFYANTQFGQLKIRIKKGGVGEVKIVHDTVITRMTLAYQDDAYDYFTAQVQPFDSTYTYHFVVAAGTDSLRFPEFGEYSPRSPVFQTPAWAYGKIYYAIYPDAFFNGDISNDPEKKLSWASPPREGQQYGGDLRGIIQKLPYIDSLDIDIVLLQPIFPSASSHKYNPKDYATVDPSLGDTVVLKTLINELHRRNRKVVLSVPFTHTGTEFPTFVDIMKNGAHSRYLDWYLIKSTPITTTPPSYECWQDDWRFPKLNLKNPQVVNYLTGYLEYWKHFGFDGFRIGEDEKIEPTFIRTMRTHIKSKYPDCLLLGSDPYLLTGNAFDGCDQYALADVLNKYFIAKTISTSDFDRWIRRLFFFNPPQSNAINIIHSSVYGSRIAEGADTETLKNMYAFIFTCLGSPLVLNGDEIGLKYKTGLNPASFPWHSEGQNQELKREIIDLIALRKTYPQIANPHFYALYVNDITRVYAYDRGGLIVVLNSGNASSYVELPAWDGTYIDLVTSATLTAFSQKLRLSVEPMTYRILRREI